MDPESDRRQRFEAIAEEVFEPLQRYLRRRALPADADDAMSEVLLTVWRRLDDAPDDLPLPWCYGIARRVLANQRRGRHRHLDLVQKMKSQPHLQVVPDPADGGADPELEEALDKLSEDDQEVLRLWAWEQLEPREMAPVLGVSVNAATLRLSRARRRLGDSLAGQNHSGSGHKRVEGTQGTQ